MESEHSDQPDKAAEGDHSNSRPSFGVYPEPVKGFNSSPKPQDATVVSGAEKPAGPLSAATADMPVPVVHVLSVRGVEYTMMTLALWFVAGALLWSLLALVNKQTSFAVLAFPVSLLLVCLPVFALLFIRLRRAELANPALRLEASKRRLSQITQIVAFIICLLNLVGFVYVVMNKLGGTGDVSIGKAALNVGIVLLIAGGILAYYWFDEHRGR
ncbi:MAG TPA: hypothetical protein VM124_04015 [Candidatus Limnocylindrales bacterium]|nr:hypothetical protein [Candidatus Limnocylindrales bacterium]